MHGSNLGRLMCKLTLCERMLVKGAHRGLQLGAAALNCAARVPLAEAVQLLWHMDMLAAGSVCVQWERSAVGAECW